MQKNFNIPDELKGIAPSLATLGNPNPYTVPTGYFDSLSEEIITAIKLGELQNKSTYSIPVGYFDSFSNNVLVRIKSEAVVKTEITLELEEIAPLLSTISKENIYSVPQNYFASVNAITSPSFSIGKVVSIKKNFKQFLHYAVAACVLFVIATSSFMYVRMHTKNINRTQSIEQRLANLNEDDIINYLTYDHQAEDLNPAANHQENQFDLMLKNTSDEEIEYFLDEGIDKDEKTMNGI